MNWKSYDPTWLVRLARESCPREPWLAEALARCTRAIEESRAYLRFVDAADPSQPDSEWQFERNLVLEDRSEGVLVLDVLRGGRVGGVEFLGRL
jgi:hypothetical protein